jgi:RHS repeat-associated protein
MTGSSQPNDIDLNQSFGYDRRNRLASWTRPSGTQSVTSSYGYDDLGNLTNDAGTAQAFSETRPHAIQSGGGGATTYGHDADGNMTSIVGGGSSRYFQFDSASRLVCADSVQDGCALSRIHYDVDGKRVFDDDPDSMKFTAFVDDTVNLNGGLLFETRIEIWAFGERIAYKRSGDDFRTAGGLGGVPWGLPPAALALLAGMTLIGILRWPQSRGALVLVIQRPAYAGVSAVLVVVLVLGPVPGVRISKAGGGGDANFYWELTDPLGTGMVMLDETGARQVHRTYSPFGVEHAAVGDAQWLPRRFGGHVEDKDSGLLYMQARWMDAESGTFLSIDPVVADSGDPQAFNAYAYARNNPRTFTDPSGMCFDGERGESPPLIFPFDALGSPLGGLTGGGSSGAGASPIQLAAEEHTRGARPSTEDKHERGEARKRRDQGKTDKAQKAGSKRPPRKPPQGWSKEGRWPPSKRAWDRWLKGLRALPPIIIFPGMLPESIEPNEPEAGVDGVGTGSG